MGEVKWGKLFHLEGSFSHFSSQQEKLRSREEARQREEERKRAKDEEKMKKAAEKEKVFCNKWDFRNNHQRHDTSYFFKPEQPCETYVGAFWDIHFSLLGFLCRIKPSSKSTFHLKIFLYTATFPLPLCSRHVLTSWIVFVCSAVIFYFFFLIFVWWIIWWKNDILYF